MAQAALAVKVVAAMLKSETRRTMRTGGMTLKEDRKSAITVDRSDA